MKLAVDFRHFSISKSGVFFQTSICALIAVPRALRMVQAAFDSYMSRWAFVTARNSSTVMLGFDCFAAFQLRNRSATLNDPIRTTKNVAAAKGTNGVSGICSAIPRANVPTADTPAKASPPSPKI